MSSDPGWQYGGWGRRGWTQGPPPRRSKGIDVGSLILGGLIMSGLDDIFD